MDRDIDRYLRVFPDRNECAHRQSYRSLAVDIKIFHRFSEHQEKKY